MADIDKNGFMCGSNIKDGSITINKIDSSEMSQFIYNYFISNQDEDWIRELIKQEIIHISEVDEAWWKEFICSLNCSAGTEFYVVPTTLYFEATGGSQSFQIHCGATDVWEING